MQPGTLYIVATPIGNLEDITPRALEALRQCDTVVCEDTRVTKRLLDHYRIDKPLFSYHHHSHPSRVNDIIERLQNGQSFALVTDAGTPGISDPGNILVSEVLKRSGSIGIVPVPGPSAVIAALSVSGFPADKFLFLGFPPHKNKRQKFFREVAESLYTVAFYESGHRIHKCLAELANVLGANTPIVVARELTKKFETLYRGTITALVEQKIDERGEFVVIVGHKK